MPPDLRSRGHKNLQKKTVIIYKSKHPTQISMKTMLYSNLMGFFLIDIMFLHIVFKSNMIQECCKYWYFFLHQTEEYELFCHLAILLCFDKCSSPNMTLLILKPTLIAVVLNMCWLRVFHNKRISLQNKNTCSVVSLSFLQNAQQSSALMGFFQIMTNW